MKKTYMLAGTAILMWSTMATVSKLLLTSLSNFQVLCISSLLAGVSMLAMNAFSGKLALLKTYRLKDYLIMTGTGLLGIFLYYSFYYLGMSRMPASQAFIINYLWPIMSVVFAAILLKEKLTAAGIDVIVPPADEIEKIHHAIFTEGCVGNIKEETRTMFLHVMCGLKQRGAQGIILGCTELGLMVSAEGSCLPLFDTAVLHAEKAAEEILKRDGRMEWTDSN